MKLSPFQIILLAAFGAFAVVGVIIFAIATNTSKSSSTGPVVIWGTLDANTFSAAIQTASEAGDTTLQQTTYVQKDPSTYQSDLAKALASGQGPDLFLMTQDETIIDAGEATPIQSTSLSLSQFQNTFIEAADPFFSQAGQAIAIPIIADPLMLYWNKDMLASAGLSQPPQYWDQLLSITTALTVKDDSGNIKKSAIDFGTYANVDHAKDILSTLIMQAGGQITRYDQSKLVSAIASNGGSLSGSTPPTLTALDFYIEFADPSNEEYTWNGSLPESIQAFADGSLGLYIGRASEQSIIAQKNPNLNYGVALLPQIRSSSVSVDSSEVYALAVARTSKNPTGAIAVAYDLASQANTSALALAFGMAPARRDVLAEITQGNQVLIDKAAVMSYSWVDPDPQATAGIFQAMIEDTASGALSGNNAVSRADGQIGEAINSQN